MASLRAGQRAYSAGRYDEAATLFAQAAARAQRIKDRDEALFLQARMYERGEHPQQAAAVYRNITTATPPGPRRARAEYELAEWEIAHGNKSRGYHMLAHAFRRWPNHGGAKHALHRLVIHLRGSGGEEAVRAQLLSWLKKLGETEAAQQLKYELGLSWLRSDEPLKAEQALLRAAREHPYPQGSLTDDALMWASKAAEARGALTPAMAYLDEMQAARESSQGGSYNRPMYPAAQYRKALLLRDKVKDLAAARAQLKVMYTRYPNSVLADDAMWHNARLALALNQRDDACDIARALREREPKSRYRRCLPQLCDEEQPLEGERPCPDYLLRELRGEGRLGER